MIEQKSRAEMFLLVHAAATLQPVSDISKALDSKLISYAKTKGNRTVR